MQPSKGINQDIHPNDLPEGFYSYAKNILCSPITNITENEPGFDESLINTNPTYSGLLTSGMRVVGVLSTTKFEIIWLTNNLRSIVGTYNQDSDTFTVVYDDDIKPKLNLNKAYPLKAVWRENFLGEIYVAWTDRLNKPRILNIQKASLVDDDKDTLLFPEFTQPEITFEIQNSGTLTAGTYYGYVQYETNDGKFTDYSLATYPIYISPDSQTNSIDDFYGSATTQTSKSIKFIVSNIDLAYDKLNFAIQRINKGTNVKEFVIIGSKNIINETSIEVIYTGGEIAEIQSPDTILVKAPAYTKAATITTLNSQLFLGNISSVEDLPIQKYINNWKVKWITSEINNTNFEDVPKFSTPKSFAHDEVYALYAVILFKSGKISQAFTIPGRAVSTTTVGSKTFNENAVIKATDNLPTEVGYIGDTSFLTEDFSLSTGNVKYFQTRDTCSWDGSKGTMGYWENEVETYPNTDDFDVYDSTGKIGTLKNTKVRHHKFPSNSFIKDTLYSADDQYGVSKIDRLGIKLEDVYLPDDILAKVDKIIISNAKRTFSNSLVVCQDKTSFMGAILNQVDQAPTDTDYDDEVKVFDQWGTLPIAASISRVFGLSGDNRIRSYTPVNIATFPLDPGYTFPNYYRLKLHSPEIINLKPGLGNCYVKLNYKTVEQISTIWEGGDYTSSSSLYMSPGSKVTSNISDAKKIIKVNNYTYVAENVVNAPSGTNTHTDCLNFSENGGIVDISNKFDFSGSGDNLALQTIAFLNDFLGPRIVTASTISNSYYNFNLNKFNTNVYSSYLQQDLVYVDSFEYADRNSVEVFNADVFLDKYSYNSFTGFPPDGPDETQTIVTDSDFTIRSNHVHFIETSLNSGMRYTTYPGNVFNRRGDTSFLLDDNILSGGNFVAINPDFNQINETLSTTIFENSLQSTSSFPHRIVSSLPITSESKIQQWTQFLPLDYYEIDKSKGAIVNLQGMADKLLIHTERSLFQTRDKATMSTDGGAVNLTSGELFEFDPVEVMPTTNGYTGTQHMFSCNLFREGYYWVDAQQGKIFCFNGQSTKELSEEGLYYFFANNLGKFDDSPHNGNGISMVEDIKHNRILMSFKTPLHNFTWSYSNILNKGGWISTHDYVFDCAFSTRNNLFSIKEGKLYRHNSLTNKGKYYTIDTKSSYIDIVFNPYNILSQDNKTGKRVFRDDAIYLNTISWNTDVITNTLLSELYKTFTHITVWNQYQHSSRITLDYNDLLFTSNINSRNAETNWSTNSFRDLVKTKSLPFIQDIFNNFGEISSNIDPTIPWYEQERFNNRWFIVRFEHDNTTNNKILMHSFEVNKTDSYR